MQRVSPPRCLLFIIFVFWTTGSLAAFSLGLTTSGSVQAGAGQGFPPKLQYGLSGSFDARIPLNGWLELAPSFLLLGVFPSDVQGGFSYRGYGGGALSLMLNGYGTIVSTSGAGTLRLGAGAGGTAALPAYQYTTLYFFYLEAALQAILDYRPAALPRFVFSLTVPLKMQFRRDMDYSISTGLALGVAYRLGS